MNPDDPRWELVRRCHDGEASPEGRSELASRLREDRDFRLDYLRYVNVDLALEGGLTASPGLLAGPRRERSRPWTWLAAAAGFVFLGVLAGLAWPGRGPSTPPAYVATLTLADQCAWAGGSLREGQRVAAGPLRLRSGTAILRFDGGASLLMRGSVELEVRTRSRALLQGGEVLVRAGEEAAGFLLETPASQVTDLGTEFAVKVESSGATELHVVEGLVSYRKPDSDLDSDSGPAGEVLLAAGRAVRFDTPAQEAPREVDLHAMRFREAVDAAVAARTEIPLLAHEPFAYPGDTMPVNEADGGHGWDGPWQPAGVWPHPADPRRPLRFLGSPSLSPGRLLDASDAFPQISRKFATPIRMDRDGIHYLSARVRWMPGTSAVEHMRQVRIILRSSTDPKRARYVLNLPVCLLPQIQRHDLEIFTSRDKVEPGDMQRWVLKIVTRENGADELHFRVFQETEPPGLLEPDRWHLSLTQERGDEALDQIVLDTYLAPDPAAFGDLRLGSTWSSVTR